MEEHPHTAWESPHPSYYLTLLSYTIRLDGRVFSEYVGNIVKAMFF